MFATKEGVIKPIVYVGFVKENRLLLVKYKTAPNPDKNGWWIPAPGLKFGEDPIEKAATVATEYGFSDSNIKLHNVESFVLPGGWHLIFHFVCRVKNEPKQHENVIQYKWVECEELVAMKDLAHGNWEIGVGQAFLQSKE